MKKALRSLTAAAAVTLAMAGPASAEIFFQDTYLSFRDVFNDKQPGYEKSTTEDAINLQYVNAWTYGSNFVSIDFEQFNQGDLANKVGSYGTEKGQTSASAEVYAVFRTTLSGNAITGTKAFAFGPFSDIGFEVGVDGDTQDDVFASYKRLVVAGPSFSFAIPKGFWNFRVHVAHEWNTNAYAGNNSTSFDPALELETAWLVPFSVGSVNMKFTGFANLIGPKGHGGTGTGPTGTEILAHPKLLVDVGKLVGFQPGQFDAGVGYEYWHNKFGNVSPNVSGTDQHAVFIEAGYHF